MKKQEETKIQEEKEQLMKDYWLGKLSSQSEEEYEIAWYSSDEDFELLKIVRDDLIEDYLTKSLNTDDKKSFEEFFLANPQNVEDVAIFNLNRKSIIAESTAQKGLFSSLFSFNLPVFGKNSTFRQELKTKFSLPQLALVASVLVIAIIFIGFFVTRNNKTPDIAKNPPQTPTPLPTKTNTPEIKPKPSGTTESPTPITPKNVNEKLPTPKTKKSPNNVKPPSNKKIQSPSPKTKKSPPQVKPKIPTLVFALAAPTRGGSTKKNSISIPQNTNNLRLTFSKPSQSEDFEKYEAQITSKDSGKIISRSNLLNFNKKKTGQSLSVSIPTSKLKKGNYKLSIVGTRSDKTSKVLTEFNFTVKIE